MLDYPKHSPSSEPRLVILKPFTHNHDELGEKILLQPNLVGL